MSKLHLFEAYGIETEYMIVDSSTLDVRPISDQLLRNAAGSVVNEVSREGTGWSNELVLHVFEIKNAAPEPNLRETARRFARDITEINALLAKHGALLLPTAMHPWMNPGRETTLWPHEYAEIYQTFHRHFDCFRHGWANLQSTQINFPFAGDREFGDLHAAIRLVLPLIPALAASSPLREGSLTGHLDTRYETYATNAASVPALTGQVIPEAVFTEKEYNSVVIAPIEALRQTWPEKDDVESIWLNARGAIARFDRDAIEIRLMDTQECARADLAVVASVVECVRLMLDGPNPPALRERARKYPTERLRSMLEEAARTGPDTKVLEEEYLSYFGFGTKTRTMSDIWKEVANRRGEFIDSFFHSPLDLIFSEGCLAQRIIRALPAEPRRSDQEELYRTLARNLAEDRPFGGAA